MSAAPGVGARAQRWPFGFALALGFALPLLAWALQARYSLSLADEGFLWYGAQRVLAGEVPLRDFQSYDIGRYYWSAAWMALLGSDGLLPLRLGNAVLAGVCVALAVALLRWGPPQPAWRMALAALTVALWMVPEYKVADNFAVLLLTAGLAGVLRAGAALRHWLWLGVCLGMASTIGINHALYGVIGVALAALLRWQRARAAPRGHMARPARSAAAAALALGAAIGYAPVLACHLLVPGFSAAFVDSIRQLAEAGTTNLEQPVPRLLALIWPLPADVGLGLRESLRALVFYGAPLFVLLCAARLLRRDRPDDKRSAAFAAASLMAVPYAHYAYSRFDVVHIAVWALPLLLAAWTFPSRRALSSLHGGALVTLSVLGALLAVPEHAGLHAARGQVVRPVQIDGQTLHVDADTAAELQLLQRLVQSHAAGGRSFYAAPYWPGAYAVMRRRSPTWEIYALFPLTRQRQQAEIERLAAARPAFAIVSTIPVDRRPELGFANTHPLIAAWLRRCFAAPSDAGPGLHHVQVWLPGDRACVEP